MVAALQRAIVFLLSGGVVAVLLVGVLSGHPWFGVACALLLVTAHALVLGAEMLCLACIEEPGFRPPLQDLLRAWADEVWVSARVFCWRQPFRAQQILDHLPSNANGRPGLLLVHGLMCNRGFWNPWMVRLRPTGTAFIAVNLEPIFGSIEHYTGTVDRAVRQLTAATGAAPVVVAHSMGGLAVRHWLRSDGHPGRVSHVVTVGTPHGGTWLARFARSISGCQMSPGSSWLNSLNAPVARETVHHLTCFYGDCDNIVFPSRHAKLPGADNRRIPRTGHVALAFDEKVFAEVQRRLNQSFPER